MADFAQILIRAKDETKNAFDSAARNMRGLEAGAAKLSGLLSTVGVGAGLSVAGLAAFAKTGIDAADSLNDMSQRLGVSVKDLASFKLAAEQSGTSLDGVGAGIARLTRSIGEAERGNKQMAAALQGLGITARDPKEAFFQLADAVQRIEDPSKRAALLSQVLGKSYQELVPLLNQGGAALRDSARQSETFADAMARLAPEADKFNDKLAELKSNAAGFAAQLIGPVVTSLNTVFDRFQRLNALPTATFFEKLTGQVSANLPSSIANVNGKIRDLESDITRLTQNSGGADASILPLKQELARLKQLKSELRTLSLSEAMKIAEAQYKKAPGSAAGVIDTSAADKTKSARAKSDPLASLLASTDIGKLAEFDKQVALLNARFDGGRKNTELYTQAMTKLVETSFADNFKQFADDQEFMNLVMQDGQDTINETNRSTEEWKATVAATSKEILYMVNPTARLVDQLEELDKFDGFMDPELLAEARLEINAQIDSVNGLGKEIDKTKSFGEEFGLTMKSAFEDAVIEGKDLRDVLGGVASDLQRIVLRKTITEPLGNAFSGLLDGIDFGSLFGFANGGIMTGAGPLPLNTYATGGIASSPQFALFLSLIHI